MVATSQLSLFLASFLSVSADLRWRGPIGSYDTFVRRPSNFGYKALIAQETNPNTLDNFLRSNIDNEANKRNTETEPAIDMLPCRNNQPGQMHKYEIGSTITLPLQWNNPHSANCEVNVYINNYRDVIPLMRPSPCGAGYKQNDISFVIPPNFPGCRSESDRCVMQIYAHSVEPRTYAMCIDFTFTGGNNTVTPPTTYTPPPVTYNPPPRVYKRAVAQGKVVDNLVPQPAIHYSDSYDTAHIDSTRSGYRGQQLQFLDPEIKAAIDLYSYIPNGGLLPTGEFNTNAINSIKNQVANAITRAENEARRNNRAQQNTLNAAAPRGSRACYQGDIYGAVQTGTNCQRQYTTTYVTNVGYQALLAEFKPKYEALGLKPYSPTIKPAEKALETLLDPKGSRSDARGNRIMPDGTVVPKAGANAAAIAAATKANVARAAQAAANVATVDPNADVADQ